MEVRLLPYYADTAFREEGVRDPVPDQLIHHLVKPIVGRWAWIQTRLPELGEVTVTGTVGLERACASHCAEELNPSAAGHKHGITNSAAGLIVALHEADVIEEILLN